MLRRLLLAPSPLALALLLTGSAAAQAPAGYYDSVDTTTGTTLRDTLHGVIDDHTRLPYTSTATDTWDVLELADQDPNNASNILDVYLNESYPKQGGGNSFYNREHTWPTSFGFPNENSSNYPYTDCHILFLCNDSYNSSRGNKPYRYGSAADSERTTVANNGQGGGSGVYPGNSNWTSGSGPSGIWETWIGRRGDVARALLYMDVRYEGGLHGVTGHVEPDLILTDNETLIANSNTGSNETVAYMGMLSVLLQWHVEDPVSAEELARNDVIFSYQGNRNPFIDHPEWVACVFEDSCGGGGDTTPPLVPVGLSAVAGDGEVTLDWADNGESDLAGYRVYRSLDGVAYTAVTGLVPASQHVDSGLSNGTTYHYAVSAEDTSGNESPLSGTASATPSGPPPPAATPWINEFHYDNSGKDTGEFVEVAGPAGIDLSGWSIVGYNGNGGSSYKTVNLAGALADQAGGFGTLGFAFSSMQNGAPDGLALVDAGGLVVDFISYEGSFTADGGPADGMTSTDVGVSESSSTASGSSLQRTGTGSARDDFSWTGPAANTQGQPNVGQTFQGGPPAPPTAPPTGLTALAGDGSVTLDWDDNSESDLQGYDVQRATAPGGPYTQLNGALVVPSTYVDSSAANGTTYYYVVTATSAAGGTSGASPEVFATPTDTSPPAAPAGLVAVAGDGSVSLDWADSPEGDLDGYHVYRGTSSGGPYSQLTAGPVQASAYLDGATSNGTTYFYVVTAVDLAGNASGFSAEASATPAAPNPPVAGFSGSPTSGEAPLVVAFTDLSTNGPTGWAWDFGDGGTSTAQDPSHTYTEAGTYTVSLTATNADGDDAEVKVAYVVVSAPPAPPAADFSGSPTTGTAPLSVNFSDASTNSPTSWSWDFGDGATSTASDPSHVYTDPGVYTVSLTVTNADGADTLVRTGYVVVDEPGGGTERYYLTFAGGTSVPGVGTVADEDVVMYDPATDTWERIFDGSDVGVTTDVNALHVRSDGNLLLSFNQPLSIPGLTGGPDGENVDDSDVVLFTFTQAGNATAGSFSFYLDGSDVGLSTNGEDIDGIAELPGGGLAISTTGSSSVPGLSTMRDEDVLVLSDTSLGSTSAGSWSVWFDGSDVGFSTSSSEDLAAVAFDGADLLFSTLGDWSASGGAGADEDVGRFSGSFGPQTSGSASLALDLSALGIDASEDVDGLSFTP